MEFDSLISGGAGGGSQNSGAVNSDTPGSDMDGLFASSPWGRLSEVGITNFGQVFGGTSGANSSEGDENSSAGGGSNPFGGAGSSMSDSPYGGNPFAGDNFWNIFAGGINPSNIGSGGLGGSSSGSPIA